VSSRVFLDLRRTREGVTRVFLNLRRTRKGVTRVLQESTSIGSSPYVNNSLFISLLLSCFVEKKYFLGNVGTYMKLGELLASA